MRYHKRNYWRQTSHQCLSFQFYHGENKETFDKKEIAETFSYYFANIGPNVAASISESKATFRNYIYYNGPCLSTINLTDLKFENAFASMKTTKVQGMMVYLPMLSKSVR